MAAARSYVEAMRLLGANPGGGSHRSFRRYVDEVWKIPTDHFESHADRARRSFVQGHQAVPLERVLVKNSTYSRAQLKKRLYLEGLKERACELCGQGELWRGKHMSLILDHINGVRDDNRLENLRIVCLNCNATLDTHCGRNVRRQCPGCQQWNVSGKRRKYCSHSCARSAQLGRARPHTRKVQRPSHKQLQRDLAASSFLAVGRKYGVSDNAVRKWLKMYERQQDDA